MNNNEDIQFFILAFWYVDERRDFWNLEALMMYWDWDWVFVCIYIDIYLSKGGIMWLREMYT